MRSTPADRFINRVGALVGDSKSQGVLLTIMVLIALVWANSPYADAYFHLLEQDFTIGLEDYALTESLHKWINDGLMALFFFLVGLEIKREFISGELSTWRKAAVPVIAALGGMVVPIVFFLLFNYGTEASAAWGIPMATDIAFTLSLVAILGTLVHNNLKVFLTALATVDDIGAILVIAFFLTPQVDLGALIAGFIYLGIMTGANLLGVRNMWFYIIVGVLGLWVALLLSGIHATLAGVLGALTIPARRKVTEREYQEKLRQWTRDFDNESTNEYALLTENQDQIIQQVVLASKRASTPLQRVERKLSPLVSYFIIPLFAFANAGVRIEGDFLSMLFHPLSLGIVVGLLAGKLIGVFAFSKVAVWAQLGRLPEQTSWSGIAGAGMMAGIGFTMSLFIAELALDDERLLQIAKIGILAASFLAIVLGALWFVFRNRNVEVSVDEVSVAKE
ncbi:Na+/H+ antiporter NhaA [Croceiramulus getboli]|nr:Na+/H+ antiporter NhaA [Flavobacteriaceae bacterium YJPT1-3]